MKPTHMDYEAIRKAHYDANVHVSVAMLVGVAVGAVIGKTSKKPIPAWQIIALGLMAIIIISIFDVMTGRETRPVLMAGVAGMLVGITVARPKGEPDK